MNLATRALGWARQSSTGCWKHRAATRKSSCIRCQAKSPSTANSAFKRMKTAMAIFEDQALAVERGYLNDA